MTVGTTNTPTPARSDRPRTRIGKPFLPGNAGRKKGNRNRSTVVGVEVCAAMSGRAVEVLRALLSARSARIRLEAVRTILGYGWGLPKATLEVSGGLSDLGRELTEALRLARLRRLALDAVVPVQAIVTAPLAIVAAAEIQVDMPADMPVREGEK
jgi:hypothetical protein